MAESRCAALPVQAQSVTQTLPSRSTKMPCGVRNIPAPKLFTMVPVESNSRTGSSFEPAQVLAPQRSATQMLVPSGSISTALVAPHVRPAGIFAQFSMVRYGLGRSLVGRSDVCAAAGAPSPASAPARAARRLERAANMGENVLGCRGSGRGGAPEPRSKGVAGSSHCEPPLAAKQYREVATALRGLATTASPR